MELVPELVAAGVLAIALALAGADATDGEEHREPVVAEDCGGRATEDACRQVLANVSGQRED